MNYFDEHTKDEGSMLGKWKTKKADLVVVWNILHHRGYDHSISDEFFTSRTGTSLDNILQNSCDCIALFTESILSAHNQGIKFTKPVLLSCPQMIQQGNEGFFFHTSGVIHTNPFIIHTLTHIS